MASQNQARQRVLEALSDVVTVTNDASAQRSAASYYTSPSAAPMAPSDPFSQPAAADSFDPLGGVGAPLATSQGRSKSTASLPRPPDEGNAAPPPPLPAKGMGARFAAAFRKQNASDKEAKRREKERRMNEKIRDSQAKSSRMDIIDRLDLSGIAGSSMFHHDSPYDACSPHANRNHKQAPVRAFDPSIDPMTGLPVNRATKPKPSNGNSRQALSPLAAATMRKMNDSAGDFAAAEDDKGSGSRPTASTPVPALGFDGSRGAAYDATPDQTDDAASTATHSDVDRDVDAERAHRNKNYFGNSSGRRDASAPNADIWGVSSEPWQDFAQPAPKGGAGGKSSLSPNDARRGKSGDSSEPTSAASSVYDMEAVMTGRYTKHLDGGGASGSGGSGTSPVSPVGVDPFPEADWGNRGSGSNGPKRSKSLLKRIKSARQNPNVPISDDLVEMGSMNLGGGGDERPSGVRKTSYSHKYSPSTPPLQAGMSPTLGGGEGQEAGLGRSGTLRSRPAPGNSPAYAAGGQQDYITAGAAEMRRGRSRDGTSPGGGGGVGRSNSIFGRFGRGKGRPSAGEPVASR